MRTAVTGRRFVIFVEGPTEAEVLPDFLGHWLNAAGRLESKVGIKVVKFEGWAEMVKDLPRKVPLYLDTYPKSGEIIAVVALLDLFGLGLPYPKDCTTTTRKNAWSKEYLEKIAGHQRFKQYFAVHETEAWLLSKPEIFPSDVSKSLTSRAKLPEQVNFDEPPAKLLDRLYMSSTNRHYRKIRNGKKLFVSLCPEIAYQKCPYLKLMLDDMLAMAKEAGL